MTALIRRDLAVSLEKLSIREHQPHAGLLLTRSLSCFEQGEKQEKRLLLDKVCAIKPDDLYHDAFKRWQHVTADSTSFASFTGAVESRLMIGLSTGGVLETGIITHHSYGMPMIPGSSVKGVARAYAVQIGLNADVLNVLFGEDEESAETERTAGAGYLVWHDAWWAPSSDPKAVSPFVGEVVTVHHQDYYAGKGEATDFDSPVPNQQIAAQGAFYFVVEGEARWATFAVQLLTQALAHQGIGAKTAAGYGTILISQEAQKKLAQQQAEQAVAASQAGMSEAQKQIDDFRRMLEAKGTHWQGQKNVDIGLSQLLATVLTFEDPTDLQAGYDTILQIGRVWHNAPLTKDKKWKERLKPLEAKLGKV